MPTRTDQAAFGRAPRPGTPLKLANRKIASEMEAAGTIEEWITEAKEIAEQLQEYEQEYSSLGSEATDVAIEATAEMVERTRNELREQLDALNELLPTPIETEGMNEQEILAEIITASASPNQQDPDTDDPASQELQRVQELRRTIN